VRSLAAILVDNGLTEIEIEGKEGRIRVVRAAPASAQPVATAAPLAAAATTQAAEVSAVDGAEMPVHPDAILSPMVGIAYLAPEPGAPVYITPGQDVVAGQTLLLIEAMKTFNQIKAPKAGKITQILITSGAPVEYGEPLLVLE
jgi:acetyl-CoA carboxylase biotin carboxyl carrier protein